MKAIWKFPLEIKDENFIEMPQGAQILCVQVQRGDIQYDMACLWALCSIGAKMATRKIVIIGTGHPVDGWRDEYAYIGTVQMDSFVWHIFDAGELDKN